MSKIVHTLISLTLVSISAFAGMAQANDDPRIKRIDIPSGVMKFDISVHKMLAGHAFEVSQGNFLKVTRMRGVSLIHIGAERLCKRDPKSHKNRPPMEYLLTLTVKSDDVLYSTPYDMSKELAELAPSEQYGCGIDVDKRQVVVWKKSDFPNR